MSNDEQTHDPHAHDHAQSADEARAQLIARRRALLAQVPDGLQDLDAAAECDCGCHPRPGQDVHHGQCCPCQVPTTQTSQVPAEHNSPITTIRAYLAPVLENLEKQLAQAAAELHMEAREVSPLGPWVVVGTIDGRGFYLRERGEQYSIVIAADDTPTLDPWTSDPAHTITVKSGIGADLTDPGGNDYKKTLHVIATAVRSYRRQASCAHPHAANDRYCAACGLPLIDPAQPTQPLATGVRPPHNVPPATPPTSRTRRPPDSEEARPS